MTPAKASVTRTRTGRLRAVVVWRLGVGLDGDALVVRAEADVDGRAVGLAHLDLPGGAVLRVALDGVRVAARHQLERGGSGGVGPGTRGPAVAVVAAHCVGDPDAAEHQRERGAAGEDRFP